jgi:hypothetical protein
MIEHIPGVKEQLEKNQSEAKKVPLFIRLPLIIIALGLPVYWMISNTGVWNYVNEFQMEQMDGGYYPVLTFFVTLFSTLIPAVLIIKLLLKFIYKTK